jgi:thermitase
MLGLRFSIASTAPDGDVVKVLHDPAKRNGPSKHIWSSFAWSNWDFDEMDKWGDFTYVKENVTELVVGVNGAKPNGYAELIDLVVKSNGEIVNVVSIRGEIIACVVKIPFEVVSSFRKQVQASGLSRYIEPNLKFQAQLVPNDPFWSFQWGPQRIEADYAWDTTIGDPSVVVAVVDSGIDYDHPDLDDNYIALGYDWVNDDNFPMDDNGHGSHVAGIIAAELDNGIGIAGIANVSIMAEKALDEWGFGKSGNLSNAIIHAVDQGANIICMSWGTYFHSELIYEAISYASDEGVLLVAAAGNEATSAKLYPAAYNEVIAVTATGQSDAPAGFTNYGEWVELAAPGVDIYSTFWDDLYRYMSGTSMSAPHVAGVAALIWSQFPDKTSDWVRARLRYTADDLGDPGFDEYYGYGRVNARRAVQQALAEHDLLVLNWERPPYVEPGGSAAINGIILNFGIENENNVLVELLADGIVVDSLYQLSC